MPAKGRMFRDNAQECAQTKYSVLLLTQNHCIPSVSFQVFMNAEEFKGLNVTVFSWLRGLYLCTDFCQSKQPARGLAADPCVYCQILSNPAEPTRPSHNRGKKLNFGSAVRTRCRTLNRGFASWYFP